MGKPKAPPPPDYAAAAKAQGEANVNSSLATNYMNQVNQTGPYGSITYNRSNTDGYTLPDGTFIPNTTVTTTLSPEQQKLYDQNVNISTQLNDLATQGIGYVAEASSKPLDLASLPPMTTSLNPAEYKNAAEKGTLGLQTLGAAPTYSNIGSGPEYNKAASAPQTQAMGNGPAYQQMGNGPNYDRLNSVGNIQTGVQGTNYQDQYDFSNVSQMPKYEDFNSSRDKITDAMMQRLQPYIDRDREALRTQLVNQGVGQGTEAYGWDMDTFQRGVNDQRIAALLAGSQEQQNLFNNAMGLRQQGVQEAFAQGNLKNSVADAMFNQRLQQGAFANSAQAQQFGQQSAITGYNNDQAAREMAAQREALGYNNTLADKTHGNQNQALEYNNDQAYKQAAFNQDANAYNNNLASQQFKDQQTTAEFNNSNAAKSFADNLASVGVNNQAQQQEYAQNQQDLLNYNQAREAQFSQGLASGQFANQAHAQALQEADYAKNAPLNMLLALKSGNQVQIPQFMNAATGTQIQPAPIYNATADGYNAQMQKYQADLQARGGFLSGLASLGSAIITSDRRLKTNINLIGQRPDGLNLYSYDYVWGQPAVGVMADEVAVLRPEALGPVVGGYATVNYGAL